MDQRRLATAIQDLRVRATTVDMRSFARALAREIRPAIVAVHRVHARCYPREHVRCRICRTHANPRPLPINGHEYRRRRRARG